MKKGKKKVRRRIGVIGVRPPPRSPVDVTVDLPSGSTVHLSGAVGSAMLGAFFGQMALRAMDRILAAKKPAEGDESCDDEQCGPESCSCMAEVEAMEAASAAEDQCQPKP